tara:strand:- start:443 stop:829 length:387 start_codon:yes stop_codon:yes gene_type:complete
MKLNFTFRQMNSIPELENHCEEKIQRLSKYELKVSWANIVVSKQRHRVLVEIKMIGKNLCLMAKAHSDGEYEAMDKAIDKLERQMAKNKEKVQKHKHAERSKEYALYHFTNEVLQVNYNYYGSKRKSA